MYKIEYQSAAQQDMINIVSYISHHLHNTIAAERLANAFITEMEKLSEFPYSMPMYYPIRPLKYEYRKLIVKNHIMFYRVDEQRKTIIVARVIYAKSDYIQKLK